MAPELCKDVVEYDHKVDIWAVGILAFVLLAGKTPFCGNRKEDIYFNVSYTKPDYNLLGSASDHAKTFIEACLQKKAADRPDVKELLRQDWFKTITLRTTVG